MKLDWAHLCKLYRERLGLKQEAMAQDFCVTQSTVSRWEAGRRLPGPHARQRILEEVGLTNANSTDALMRLTLDQGKSVVALWDREGYLRASSPRFHEELAKSSKHDDLIGRHADEIVENKGLMSITLKSLEESGFFEGKVPFATLVHAPAVNAGRVSLGGTVTATLLPKELASGEIGIFSAYEHDVMNPSPTEAQVFTTPPVSQATLSLS